ncbi:bifunctional [glutamate--ammonia ligase]-adenylyl-L-tyrosine phosphorylase/[glutamate--ammonia-ligase] adenylyltransferase [Methylobacillus sp.]|uniref:bifunctional [glutamate--ammonia ligase]-adenylyl-L-tyrosine phosphorylase/[glutamate--ammonia-ligase] adenylyltransferase n=1 Tax=Methylobacillus sp. TaxID=56818 RepID=UPI002FDFF104
MRTLSQILQPDTGLSRDEQYLLHAVKCSPFIARLVNSDADLLPELAATMHQPWAAAEMRDWLAQQAVTDDASLKHTLRQLRQRVMLRLIVRDLNGLADLDEVMHVVSALAEVTLQYALQHLTPWLQAQYGVPVGEESGEPQQLIVVGMGKLGGNELNVSSDIDLIFAFSEDGETSGTKKSISNVDFFTRLAKRLIAAIDEITEDGFVFRVDMRLRPYGSEGPLACSFAMLEEYYQNQGREWERYAWIKGRVVAGPDQGLSQMLRPFVFRKYLDFGVFASMRDLKMQIQREVNRRDMHDNIKLGRGGIREVEFIAQVFQLMRGGRDASLQIRPTMAVLDLLGEKGLLTAAAVIELKQAYVFLRNLEHRLQYLEDAQTQDLPASEENRARIALGMGYADWETFLAALDQHRNLVQHHFEEVFSDPADERSEEDEPQQEMALWKRSIEGEDASAALAQLGYAEPEETLRKLLSLHDSPRYKQLPEISRQRFDALVPLAITEAAQEPEPDKALIRVADLLDSICRRASYLALLVEYPSALTLVTRIVGASPWLAQYLTRHPILLDELLDTRNLYATPDFAAMHADLERRVMTLSGDVERQMDEMRQFKHAAVFRFAAKDVAGELALETLSDYLSALADIILDVAIKAIWPSLRQRHREEPQFAIIGYGKLGGKELGYASDLDIIFLYDDDAPEAGEVYAKLGQRLNTWLGSMTSAGILYETDMQLRPDGASGLLVSSVQAFRTYQQEKAWVWEHQALTRARFCAGKPEIGLVFEQIREDVLCQQRDKEMLKTEVVNMRQKMHQAHPNYGELFDLKHDRGGIVDVEFIVQYLVLAYASQYRELTRNLGNIALLEMLGGLGLVDAALAHQVAQNYRDYRRRQHAIRLQGNQKARVPLDKVSEKVAAVRNLWQQVFGRID